MPVCWCVYESMGPVCHLPGLFRVPQTLVHVLRLLLQEVLDERLHAVDITGVQNFPFLAFSDSTWY